MKKIFAISLSLLIVILSFSICFADSGSPIILPVGEQNDLTSGYFVDMADGTADRYYRASSSPVYMVFYSTTDGGPYKALFFSETIGAHVYNNSVYDPNPVNFSLSSTYNGYYFTTSSTFPVTNESIVISDSSFTGPTDVIDYVQNSVFSTSFNLTYLVNGSISWLSTFAQAVKNSPLLLFFVVFIFVGIGIGLLNRFRRG